MKYHVIYPSGKIKSGEWAENDTTLYQQWKGVVDGFPELASVLYEGKPATLVVNDRGAVEDKAINPAGVLPPNARATAIYWTATIIGRTGVTFAPLTSPMIHGTAILIEKDKREL